MRIDREDDALYLRLDESRIVESEEVQPGVILDFDENGIVVGIEMLGLSNRVSAEHIQQIELETTP